MVNWLDHFPGGKTYTFMFLYQTLILIAGILAAIGILKIKKNNQRKLAEAGENAAA